MLRRLGAADADIRPITDADHTMHRQADRGLDRRDRAIEDCGRRALEALSELSRDGGDVVTAQRRSPAGSPASCSRHDTFAAPFSAPPYPVPVSDPGRRRKGEDGVRTGVSACGTMAEYEPSDETLAVIARRHGGAAGQVRPLAGGVANRVYLLGDDLVLRVPRAGRFLPDLVKEAAVIPAARRAGVRAPEVVAFDDTCSVAGVPYMVLARARGADLADLDLPAAGMERVFREVGRELAKLHRLSPATAPALAALPVDDGAADPWALTGRLLEEGWIDAGHARWLTGWLDRLSAHLPEDPPVVLVHGDIAPQNLVVAPETARLDAIVDWGDAQWADPATDFAKIPLNGVPAALDGYRREAGEGAWEARVLWFHLVWALGRLADPVPRPRERHWSAPPAGRLLGLLRFFASGPPAPWDSLA
ncbi:hypothetical protein GCM10010149_46750 [Nonomuraea roseoviolacea subsp. roseoviolacea]